MFCREMDSDNHNAPCFPLAGLLLLPAALNRHQASRQSFQRRLEESAFRHCVDLIHSKPAGDDCFKGAIGKDANALFATTGE